MIKVYILNLKGFLETVNKCSGRVMVCSPTGQKTDITRQYLIQRELEKEYQKNGSYLPLSLTFDEPRDYMAVVTSYISGC